MPSHKASLDDKIFSNLPQDFKNDLLRIRKGPIEALMYILVYSSFMPYNDETDAYTEQLEEYVDEFDDADVILAKTIKKYNYRKRYSTKKHVQSKKYMIIGRSKYESFLDDLYSTKSQNAKEYSTVFEGGLAPDLTFKLTPVNIKKYLPAKKVTYLAVFGEIPDNIVQIIDHVSAGKLTVEFYTSRMDIQSVIQSSKYYVYPDDEAVSPTFIIEPRSRSVGGKTRGKPILKTRKKIYDVGKPKAELDMKNATASNFCNTLLKHKSRNPAISRGQIIFQLNQEFPGITFKSYKSKLNKKFLKRMVELYDEHFFGSRLGELFFNAGYYLSVIWGTYKTPWGQIDDLATGAIQWDQPELKSTLKKTHRRVVRGKKKVAKLTPVFITISKGKMLKDTFHAAARANRRGMRHSGIVCRTPLEVICVVFEHETVHALVTTFCKKVSSKKSYWKGKTGEGGHGHQFMRIAHNIFRLTEFECDTKFIGNNYTKKDFNEDDMVFFFDDLLNEDSKKMHGIIKKLENKVAVVVQRDQEYRIPYVHLYHRDDSARKSFDKASSMSSSRPRSSSLYSAESSIISGKCSQKNLKACTQSEIKKIFKERYGELYNLTQESMIQYINEDRDLRDKKGDSNNTYRNVQLGDTMYWINNFGDPIEGLVIKKYKKYAYFVSTIGADYLVPYSLLEYYTEQKSSRSSTKSRSSSRNKTVRK